MTPPREPRAPRPAGAPSGTTRPEDVPHVLSYWLAMIRHEEALGRVLRVAMGPARPLPDVAQPNPGQAYVKLLPDALADPPPDAPAAARRAATADFLLQRRASLAFPVTDERAGFLEHLLDRAYRRERSARFGHDEGDDAATLVGFPTLHFAPKGELATLLRFPVSPPEWHDARGATWAVPRYKERVRGAPLTPPATLHLVEAPPADEDEPLPLPYALDTHHAARTLGVPEEHTTRLLDALTLAPSLAPAAMIAAVTALLRGPDDDYPEAAITAALATTASPEALLADLHAAVCARPLPTGVRAFPIGLAWDASQAMTTRGLQQDLRALLADPPPPAPATPLSAYLHGLAPPPAHGLHLGQRGPHALTADQRAVADRALRQPLVCAQGPPGTGKTELILNLAAHALVDQIARAEPPSAPAPRVHPPLVVTSTNNRAVDNVLDPLTRDLPDDALPLALRVGSFAVLEEVTLPTLQRALAWLAASPASDPAADRARWLALQAEVAVEHARLHAERSRARLAAGAADALPAAAARAAALLAAVAPARARLARLPPERAAALRHALAALADVRAAAQRTHERLDAEGTPGPTRLVRAWRKLVKGPGDALAAALAPLGATMRFPRGPAQRDDWEEAFVALDAALEGTAADLWGLAPGDEPLTLSPLAFGARDAECADAEAERDLLERAAAERDAWADPARAAALAAAERALFVKACLAREAWARAEREPLTAALNALTTVDRARAGFKQRLAEQDVRATLFTLFPVVGCTLLSLGNAFPLEPEVIDLAVIDEAGQCHPAYAVSALARAKRALVIGDPHQLEPVLTLDEAEEARVLRRTHCPLDEPARAPFSAVAERGRSAQTLAARATREVLALHDHFRCQAPIIAVSDALCGYGLRVRTAPRSLAARSRHLPAPLVLHDIRGDQAPRAGSWANEAEVERVALLVRALLRDGLDPGQLAVLTPYRGQLVALKARLRRDGVPLDDDASEPDPAQGQLFGAAPPGGLALGTVHRFQGGERDVVIFSTVVSRERSLGFTNRKVNLVNVAVSRARLHLVVVGHGELLEQGEVTSVLVRAVAPAHRLPPVYAAPRAP